MVNLELVLIASALVGAGLNVLRGWSKSSESFDLKKTVGAAIVAVIAALGAISVFDVSTLGGYIQAILVGLLTGFSAEYAVNKLKK